MPRAPRREGRFDDDALGRQTLAAPLPPGGVSSEWAPDADFAHPPGYVEFDSSSRIVLNYSTFEAIEEPVVRPHRGDEPDFHRFD